MGAVGRRDARARSSAVQPGAALAAAAVAAVRVRVGGVRGVGVLSLAGWRAGAVTETEELAMRGTRTIRAPVHKGTTPLWAFAQLQGPQFSLTSKLWASSGALRNKIIQRITACCVLGPRLFRA